MIHYVSSHSGSYKPMQLVAPSAVTAAIARLIATLIGVATVFVLRILYLATGAGYTLHLLTSAVVAVSKL